MNDRQQYTIEQFQAAYDLSEPEAARLYAKFGPFKTDLDVLMAGKIDRARQMAPQASGNSTYQ
jgi:hypothetical protein